MLSPETIAELRRHIADGFLDSLSLGRDDVAELLDDYESVERYKKCADEAVAERNYMFAKHAQAVSALIRIVGTGEPIASGIAIATLRNLGIEITEAEKARMKQMASRITPDDIKWALGEIAKLEKKEQP